MVSVKATVMCSPTQPDIQCDPKTYRIKRSSREITCPKNYNDYLIQGETHSVSRYLWICAAAKDRTGRLEGFTQYPVQFKVDSTNPTVIIRGMPTSPTSIAYAYIDCSDDESGCDEDSFGMYFKEDSQSCSRSHVDYDIVGAGQLEVTKSGYVCGFGRDNAGNTMFRGPIKFTVSG